MNNWPIYYKNVANGELPKPHITILQTQANKIGETARIKTGQVVSTKVSGILFARFPTVKHIPTISRLCLWHHLVYEIVFFTSLILTALCRV